MKIHGYEKIAKTFNYCELCTIEKALHELEEKNESDKEKITELKERIVAARGWLKIMNKTDRKEK